MPAGTTAFSAVSKTILRQHWKPLLVLTATWGAYFGFLFGRILQMRSDGLYAGHVHIWGDWALHIGIANIFAYKAPEYWFAYHPIYAGGKFTYPFFPDFVSGMLMRLGVPLASAFLVPSILFSIALLVGLYCIIFLLLRSKTWAIGAISLFLLSSGLGFMSFLSDFAQDPILQALAYPAKEYYTRIEMFDWLDGNVISGLLMPQRSFLFGMTFGIWSLAGLLYVLRNPQRPPRERKIMLVSAGVFAGVLPVISPHSFMAIVALSACMCFAHFKQWRALLWYIISAGLISGVLYLTFISGGIENESFAKWLPGWSSKGGVLGWLTMWFQIWGVMLPIAIAGLFAVRHDRASKAFFVGMALIFIAANLFQFQPIRWDNSKLFFWVYFGCAVLASAALKRLWEQEISQKLVAALLIFLLAFTGALQLIRLQRIDKNTYQMTNSDDMNLGKEIRERTDPLARFLTAPSHNHLVTIWGVRPIVMGYAGWVWNFGYSYWEREQDVRQMYLGGDDTPALLKKYNISYVVIGPAERYDLQANESFFASRYPIAFTNPHNNVYDTRALLKP